MKSDIRSSDDLVRSGTRSHAKQFIRALVNFTLFSAPLQLSQTRSGNVVRVERASLGDRRSALPAAFKGKET